MFSVRKKDMVHKNKFENLPRDIIAEILSRVSPDSLMLCKSLNKSWYFIIRCLVADPEFVQKHLHRSKTNPTTLLVHRNRFISSSEFFLSMIVTGFSDNGDNEGHIGCVDADYVKLPRSLGNMGRPDISHCDGIVAFLKNSDISTLFLCNPALKEFHVFEPRTELDVDEYDIFGMGIGCDPSSGNYKVFRLLNSVKAEVFTVGAYPHYWRVIEISIDPELYGRPEDQISIEGYCLWLMPHHANLVLCFDVCSETFHTIALPSQFLEVGNFELDRRLVVRNSCVCVCMLWWPEHVMGVDIWEMDIVNAEVGLVGPLIWTNRVRILWGEVCFPRCFWKSDEMLVTRTGSKGLECYNLQTRMFRRTDINEEDLNSLYSGSYVRSIVSITRMQQV